jgi:hypothetical protein
MSRSTSPFTANCSAAATRGLFARQRNSAGNGNVVLISAANAENVTIEGRGTIDGDGANFYTGVGDGTGPADARRRPSPPTSIAAPHGLLSLHESFAARRISDTRRVSLLPYPPVQARSHRRHPNL